MFTVCAHDLDGSVIDGTTRDFDDSAAADDYFDQLIADGHDDVTIVQA